MAANRLPGNIVDICAIHKLEALLHDEIGLRIVLQTSIWPLLVPEYISPSFLQHATGDKHSALSAHPNSSPPAHVISTHNHHSPEKITLHSFHSKPRNPNTLHISYKFPQFPRRLYKPTETPSYHPFSKYTLAILIRFLPTTIHPSLSLNCLPTPL